MGCPLLREGKAAHPPRRRPPRQPGLRPGRGGGGNTFLAKGVLSKPGQFLPPGAFGLDDIFLLRPADRNHHRDAPSQRPPGRLLCVRVAAIPVAGTLLPLRFPFPSLLDPGRAPVF